MIDEPNNDFLGRMVVRKPALQTRDYTLSNLDSYMGEPVQALGGTVGGDVSVQGDITLIGTPTLGGGGSTMTVRVFGSNGRLAVALYCSGAGATRAIGEGSIWFEQVDP